MQTNATAAAPLWKSLSSDPATPPTLLLVDDDRVIRVMLRTTLQQQGYEVIAANDAKEALDMLNQHSVRIDTIILDREMPGMNGLEMVAVMKKKSDILRHSHYYAHRFW